MKGKSIAFVKVAFPNENGKEMKTN